jgi:hypothetical protein
VSGVADVRPFGQPISGITLFEAVPVILFEFPRAWRVTSGENQSNDSFSEPLENISIRFRDVTGGLMAGLLRSHNLGRICQFTGSESWSKFLWPRVLTA